MRLRLLGGLLALIGVMGGLGGCATVQLPGSGEGYQDANPAPAVDAAPPPVQSDAGTPPAPLATSTAAVTSTAPVSEEQQVAPAAIVGDTTESDRARQSPAPLPGDTMLRPLSSALDEDPQVRADLWGRVRSGFSLPELDNPLVRKWEDWYAARPEYVQRMTQRASRYLFHIVEEVNRRGLPMELALLPFIESAFNPQALSTARASGIWQFMPATGRAFELRQNLFRDDRRDVLASTRAALDYLQSLHKMFGDWSLALAAYNWGQGNVQRALERNRRARQPERYEALQMPAETRNYVPKLQAVRNIVARPADFGLQLPALENHPFFLSVAIERDIDVDLAARLAGLDLEEFRMLNPQIDKPVVLAAGTPQLLLPYDNANRFLRELASHVGPLASWTAWVVPRTLNPAQAARMVGMSEGALRDVNRIPTGMLIKAGSTIVVHRSAHRSDDVDGLLAQAASMSLAPVRPAARPVAERKSGNARPAKARQATPQRKAAAKSAPSTAAKKKAHSAGTASPAKSP